MENVKSPECLVFFCAFLTCWTACTSQTYDQAKAVIDDKLSPTVYSKVVRPMNDQTQRTIVDVSFELVSIVSIDDVSQTFVCNGFVTARWTDERLVWDPASYGGVQTIFPETKQIWRPRMILFNTLDERDLFEDDHSPMTVQNNGNVFWVPGSLFPTSCELNMAKFPFDEQICSIQIIAMNYDVSQLQFVSTTDVGSKFYVPHGEWELLATSVLATEIVFDQAPVGSPTVTISFQLKRRPLTFLLNILLPVVFLSVLNILVFLIPVESGEKIGYGITVLLALAVFLSIVSSMLPSSSGTIPYVTIHMFCLLIISVLTVVDTIVIVYLHNLEVKETQSIKATDNYHKAFQKVNTMNKVNPMSTVNIISTKMKESTQKKQLMENETNSLEDVFTNGSLTAFDGNEDGKNEKSKECNGAEKKRVNKYQIIGKHIDKVSLVVFSILWVCMTIGFLITITT